MQLEWVTNYNPCRHVCIVSGDRMPRKMWMCSVVGPPGSTGCGRFLCCCFLCAVYNVLQWHTLRLSLNSRLLCGENKHGHGGDDASDGGECHVDSDVFFSWRGCCKHVSVTSRFLCQQYVQFFYPMPMQFTLLLCCNIFFLFMLHFTLLFSLCAFCVQSIRWVPFRMC